MSMKKRKNCLKMLLIRKGLPNALVLTLSELASPNLPNNWLFRFVLDQSDEYEYLLQLNDVAPQGQNQYNLFVLNEGVDVTFQFLGDYLYEVYQMPNSTSTDYTLGHKVEIGKMRVIEMEEARSEFDVNINFKIYDKDNIS